MVLMQKRGLPKGGVFPSRLLTLTQRVGDLELSHRAMTCKVSPALKVFAMQDAFVGTSRI